MTPALPPLPKVPPPSLFQIARAFLLLGVLGFGGQAALLVLLTRDLVERRGWLAEADITESFTYTKLLPGSTVVQVVAYLGWKLGGGKGAAVAAACFLFPAVLFMLALAALYRFVADFAGVRAALNGLTAAVVGLVAVATWTLGRKSISDVLGLLVAILVCTASALWGVNPALLVVAAGLLGVAREAWKGGKQQGEEVKTP